MSDKVCIIGAGSSGVTTAKALKEAGVDFDVFEIGSDIGGMWRYENDNGLSSAYRSLHIDTSRRGLGYSDFPIPDTEPDFLSHDRFLAYLERYCDFAGVRPHIRFKTKVEAVRPVDDGLWDVTLSTGETQRYRAVVVANGHLWDPRWPEFPGRFDGVMVHSHDYRTAAPYEDKDVLVVGIGNSAVDIAVDACRRARSVSLSMRRGAWVMPKYLMGVPLDRWSAFFSRKLGLSTKHTRMIVSRLARLATGDQRRFGVPRPAHPVWREHSTISQELLPYVGHGRIKVRPNVDALRGGEVAFVDGQIVPFDAIICATGYRTSFPFLDPSVFTLKDNAAQLYRRMTPPDRPGLYFAGLIQPVGPTIPLVEMQGRWLAGVLSGKVRLPGKLTMDAEAEAHRKTVAQTYVGSARYTLEVDIKSYVKDLKRDLAEG